MESSTQIGVPAWLVIVLVIVGVTAFALLEKTANDHAIDISTTADANESGASSAPQESVAAEWAIRDLEIERVHQGGVQNGLLALCAALLLVIAIANIRRGSPPQSSPTTSTTQPPLSPSTP